MATKKTSKSKAPPGPVYPYSIDMYHDPSYALREGRPMVGNGTLNIVRYRVTVERVDDSDDVLRGRLIDLWETTEYNYHHSDLFDHEAKRLGIELPNKSRGIRAAKKGQS